METLRIETELERQKSSRGARGSTENRDSGVADVEVCPCPGSCTADRTEVTDMDAQLKRSALSNSLLDIHEQCKCRKFKVHDIIWESNRRLTRTPSDNIFLASKTLEDSFARWRLAQNSFIFIFLFSFFSFCLSLQSLVRSHNDVAALVLWIVVCQFHFNLLPPARWAKALSILDKLIRRIQGLRSLVAVKAWLSSRLF